MKTIFFNNFVATMLLLCLLSPQGVLAQSPECGLTGANSQNISMPCMINFASNPYTPIARVRMRFHFLPRLDGRPQFTQAEALNIATSMVSFSNQNLSNLNQANVAGPNGIPQRVQDSRIRFDLHSTSGDNGVVVYNNGETDIPSDNYGTGVVNIVFTYCYNSLPDSTNSCCWNAAVDFNRIDFCNIWTTIKQASAQEDRARLLVHEMGHILSLNHTFSCGNECESVDISPTAECGGTCEWNGSDCSFRGNNIMSYRFGSATNNNTALTPCQWEHMFNWIISQEPPFVVWDCQKSNTPLTVSGGSVTWNDLRLLNVDVIVQSGTTLTINCDVRFVNGCSIQVQSGASLVVNSAKITNMCGGQWTGIVSQGNVTLNSATLEHAITSVSRQGGSFASTSTTFSNNTRDIEYLNKAVSPVDIHSGSTFIVNNNYRGSIIRSRVTMWNSQNINFRGCTFDNQYGNPWNLSWNAAFDWQGIYAVESHFYVDELPGNPIKSTTFRNFYAGIRTANLGQNRRAEIRNSHFTDNYAGIISENTNSLIVHKNKFDVNWGSSFPAGEWYRVGLLINTGSGYTVSNNEFKGNLSNGGSGQYIFGTQVIRTGSEENRLEGNRFENLYVGHRILGNNTNASSSSPSGLQLFCTQNSQNIYDHDIEDDGDSNSGIRLKQGEASRPDGNTFSNNGIGPDIWSNTLAFERFFQSSVTNAQASSVVGPVTQTPTNFASNCSPFTPFLRAPNTNTGIANAQKATYQTEGSLTEGNNVTVSSANKSNTLAESFSLAQLSELSRDFEEAEAALQAAKRQYSELIDGGNQGQLLSNVRTRWNRDTATLRRELSALSPNLSTEVLIATAQLNVLSNQILMQLLKANPSACRSNKLKKVLTQELRTPFADTDFQSLLSISSRGSRRSDVEDAISMHSSRRGDVARYLISGLMTDQDANKDDLRYWWTRIGTRHAQYNLAESYIKDNQSNRYEAQLRGLNRDLADFEVQMKENDEYVSLYGIKSKVLKSGRSWQQMTSAEIEQVRRIANNTRGDAAVQANNILCYAFGECKPLEVPRFNNNVDIQGLKAQAPNTSNAAAKSANQFVAYPNPAHGIIHVDYNLEGQFEDAYVSLIDFTGREIKRQKIYANRSQVQWQTEQMQSGLYLITIYSDKRLVWQTKISIQK